MRKAVLSVYTDVARTAAVTAGHAITLVGAAGRAAGCPVAPTVEKVGRVIAKTAVTQCSEDTPKLIHGCKR